MSFVPPFSTFRSVSDRSDCSFERLTASISLAFGLPFAAERERGLRHRNHGRVLPQQRRLGQHCRPRRRRVQSRSRHQEDPYRHQVGVHQDVRLLRILIPFNDFERCADEVPSPRLECSYNKGDHPVAFYKGTTLPVGKKVTTEKADVEEAFDVRLPCKPSFPRSPGWSSLPSSRAKSCLPFLSPGLSFCFFPGIGARRIGR
jgi:hypothetical protein